MKNKTLPKIAILLPVYKGFRFLNKQFESIQNQKNVNISIFISLDPSADGSLELINNLEKKYTNVKVLRHSKVFRTPTKNFFYLINKINEKQFDYISFADQDDIWFKDKIFNAVKKIKKLKIDCYSGSVIAFNEKSKKKIIKSNRQTKNDHWFESAGPGSTYLMSSFFINRFKKFIIKKKQAHSFENYDWLIYAFAKENNFKWFIDKKPVLFYRQHLRNHTGARWGLKSYLYRLKIVLEGSALKKVIKLKKLILNSNKNESNFIFDFSKLYYIKNSFSFRRNFIDKFLIFFYFIIVAIFGKFEEQTFKIKIKKFLDFFIIITFIYIGKNFLKDYFSKINEFSLSNIFIVFFIFSIIFLLVCSRFYFLINQNLNKKINFLQWFKIFIDSQVFSIFLPYTSIFYRYYYLNKINKISFFTLATITIYIFLNEQLILYNLLSLNIFLNNIELKIFLLTFFVTSATLFFILKFNSLKDYLNEKIKNKLIFNRFKFQLATINTKNYILITILSILKIIFGCFLFYIISKNLNINLELNQILLIFMVNELLQHLKITPQNIGITEIIFAIIFNNIFLLSNSDGIIYKIHHRVLEIMYYLTMSIVLKIVTVIGINLSSSKNQF